MCASWWRCKVGFYVCRLHDEIFFYEWMGRLRTSLCLQYKPHYIAAGSVALAASFQKVKLPKEKGKVWWMEFDVTPKQLDG